MPVAAVDWVPLAPAGAPNLPADRGDGAPQLPGDLSQRQPLAQTHQDVLALNDRQTTRAFLSAAMTLIILPRIESLHPTRGDSPTP